jgi:hypothetical protein
VLEGNTPHEAFDYPEAEFRYWQFADRYGWLPNQVDEQPVYFMDWILAIGNLKTEIQNEQARKDYGTN